VLGSGKYCQVSISIFYTSYSTPVLIPIRPALELNRLNSCYVDCPNVPDAFSAQLESEKDCATANAYDKGVTDVPATWTTPGPQTATVTPSDVSVPAETDRASRVQPTSTMNKAEETAKPSNGAASGKAAGSWLALLGFGLGIAL